MQLPGVSLLEMHPAAVLKQLMGAAHLLSQSSGRGAHCHLPPAALLPARHYPRFSPRNLIFSCFPRLFSLGLSVIPLNISLGTSDPAISSITLASHRIMPFMSRKLTNVKARLTAELFRFLSNFWQLVCTPWCIGQENYMFCLYLLSAAIVTSAPFNPLASSSTVLCRCNGTVIANVLVWSRN